eukprot:6815475-Alexandrium_andersonii.AAC.1
MSASLVGSEMCIRDRCSTRRIAHPSKSAWTEFETVWGLRSPSAERLTHVRCLGRADCGLRCKSPIGAGCGFDGP